MNAVGSRFARDLRLPEALHSFSSGTVLFAIGRVYPEVQSLGDRIDRAAYQAGARRQLAPQHSQVRPIGKGAPKSSCDRGNLLAALQGMRPRGADGATDILADARRLRPRCSSATHCAFGLVRSVGRTQTPRVNAFAFVPGRSRA
jgi:hypothetical protein